MTVIDPSLDKGRSQGAAAPFGEVPASLDAAMIAHDLRCALQGVTGGVAVLEKAITDPDLREQLARVFEAASGVSTLANILLGADPARSGVVEIGAFVERLRRRWSAEARAKGLVLVLDAAGAERLALRVDGLLLGRVIGNLLCNAIGHTEAGSVTLSVEHDAERGLSFHLRDDGPGVDPAVLERDLAGDGRSAEGEHGLGLRIVRALSEQLGGELLLRNRSGGGFEARLGFAPRVCVEASPPPPPVERGEARREHDLRGVRILLAEDNPTNQMVATQMLTALKAEVTIASDGVEALEHFERDAFDLVVVDIEMPRMSGLDVIRAIRARQDPRSAVPIVALTAYAMREHQDRIARAGANGLISKPISSIEALGRALAAHVAVDRTGAVPPAEAASPVVDLAIYAALRQAIGPDMMAELMEKVVADLQSARSDLTLALEPLNRDVIRSASHILISVAGAVGVTRLQNAARDLNNAAHGAEEDSLAERLRHCLDELEHAITFARGQLAEC